MATVHEISQCHDHEAGGISRDSESDLNPFLFPGVQLADHTNLWEAPGYFNNRGIRDLARDKMDARMVISKPFRPV